MKIGTKFDIDAACFLWCRKTPKRFIVAVKPYTCHPRSLAGVLAEEYTLKSRCVVFPKFGVDRILKARGCAQIFARVIQCIAINVICLPIISALKSKDHPMHVYGPSAFPFGYPNEMDGIKILRKLIPKGNPLESIHALKVFWAHASYLAFCKLNFTVGWFLGCHRSLHSGAQNFASA